MHLLFSFLPAPFSAISSFPVNNFCYILSSCLLFFRCLSPTFFNFPGRQIKYIYSPLLSLPLFLFLTSPFQIIFICLSFQCLYPPYSFFPGTQFEYIYSSLFFRFLFLPSLPFQLPPLIHLTCLPSFLPVAFSSLLFLSR